MLRLLGSLLPSLRFALRTSTDLALENLALRQQVAALREQVKRPRVPPTGSSGYGCIAAGDGGVKP